MIGVVGTIVLMVSHRGGDGEGTVVVEGTWGCNKVGESRTGWAISSFKDYNEPLTMQNI